MNINLTSSAALLSIFSPFLLTACGDNAGTQDTNSPPVALSSTLSLVEDTPLTFSLSAIDADGDPLSYEIAAGPANGTLSGTLPNIVYTPNTDYYGVDSFEFHVSDGTVQSGNAVVNLVITSVNDAPSLLSDAISVNEDSSIDYSFSATDADGDPLSFTLVAGPVNGTLSGTLPDVVYTPNPDYFGSDAFQVQVSDGELNSNTAIISVTVNGVPDAPVATSAAVSVSEDSSLDYTLLAIDADGDPLTYELVAGPANGTLSGTLPDVVYTPNPDYSGSDDFQVRVSDGVLGSNTASISITVNSEPDAPAATSATVSVSEDSSFNYTLLATDADGDALTYELVTGPANGTLSGTLPDVAYTPNANYSGVDSIEFRASDGVTTSNVATLSIEVVPVNDGPVASNDAITVTYNTAPYNGTLLGSDIDSPNLTYAISQSPSNGALTITNANTGDYIYTPSISSGTDQFAFSLTDGQYTVNGIVSVTITAGTTTESEPNNDSLTASIVSITEVVSGDISNDTDEDWYQFDTWLATTGNFSVTIQAQPSVSSEHLLLELYDASLNHLSTVEVVPGTTGDTQTLNFNGWPPGIYFLVVKDAGYRSAGVDISPTPTEGYSLSITESLIAGQGFEHEPNNSSVSPHFMGSGTSWIVSGHVATDTDEDWYQFDTWLATTGNFSVTIQAQPSVSSEHLLLELCDASLNHLSTVEVVPGTTGDTQTLNFNGWPPGIYFLVVKDAGYRSAEVDISPTPTEGYSLSITESLIAGQGFEHEPNNSAASPSFIDTGLTVAGHVATDTDEDWYQFIIDSPTTGNFSVTIEAQPSVSSEHLLLELYDGSLNHLSTVEVVPGSTGDTQTLNFNAWPYGTFFLAVKDAGYRNAGVDISPTPTEGYSFSITESLIAGQQFEHEPNNSSLNPHLMGNGIGQTVSGHVATDTDEDWYQFDTGATSGNFSVTIEAQPSVSSESLLLELYDGSLNHLSTVEVVPGTTGDTQTLNFSAGSFEIYYLAVKDAGYRNAGVDVSPTATEGYSFIIQ